MPANMGLVKQIMTLSTAEFFAAIKTWNELATYRKYVFSYLQKIQLLIEKVLFGEKGKLQEKNALPYFDKRMHSCILVSPYVCQLVLSLTLPPVCLVLSTYSSADPTLLVNAFQRVLPQPLRALWLVSIQQPDSSF